jgi:hypothetical protein
MNHWLTLRPSSIFWTKFVHSTNIENLGEIVFRYRKGRMIIKFNETNLVDTDGRGFLHIGDEHFRNFYIGNARQALESKNFTLEYGPALASIHGGDERTISFKRGSSESYVICHHDAWVTYCEIRSLGSVFDPQIMLGCLAFFWVEAEKERRWT